MTETYDISDVLPESPRDTLPAGTNIAIVGPSMVGKRELALELLASRYVDGNGVLCITTDGARTVYEDLERHVESVERDRVGIVDSSGGDTREGVDATVETVTSPGDLTGISIGASKLAERFGRRGIADIGYGLVSVSTLLQYLDSKAVFRFLHIYTRRIEQTGGLGIYTLDDDSHDPKVVNTITGQFDGVIELREADAGDIEFRLRGFGTQPMPWEPL
jgi:KaiC/GvpD/RAD55 family RecA-like ATPase